MTKEPLHEKLRSFAYGVQDFVVGLKRRSLPMFTHARQGSGACEPASYTTTEIWPVSAPIADEKVGTTAKKIINTRRCLLALCISYSNELNAECK